MYQCHQRCRRHSFTIDRSLTLPTVQTGVPMTALSVVGAQWRLRPQDRWLLWGTFMPWALRAGSRCPDLLTVYYEKHFEVCLHCSGLSSLAQRIKPGDGKVANATMTRRSAVAGRSSGAAQEVEYHPSA